jgi:hypothetical protein
MSGDYLWDRSGPPDPEIVALERTLGSLALTGSASPHQWPSRSRRRVPAKRFVITCGALAAMVIVLVGIARRYSNDGANGLQVTRVTGTPMVSAQPLLDRGELKLGHSLDTEGDARATIDIAGVGQVNVEPDSRVTLLSTRSGDYRLRLQRGTMHALIWAPPGQFFVETPSATAVDLGCAYTISVDGEGIGTVRVTSGWVGFEWRGRESFIPAGAMCTTRPGLGPGTPYYEDTSTRLQSALVMLDMHGGSREQRRAALDVVLHDARERDALTLWHLLTRVDADERDSVFDRLAQFVAPPSSVTREGVRAGRQDMLDAWWDSLGFGTTQWWRHWKQPWRELAPADRR